MFTAVPMASFSCEPACSNSCIFAACKVKPQATHIHTHSQAMHVHSLFVSLQPPGGSSCFYSACSHCCTLATSLSSHMMQMPSTKQVCGAKRLCTYCCSPTCKNATPSMHMGYVQDFVWHHCSSFVKNFSTDPECYHHDIPSASMVKPHAHIGIKLFTSSKWCSVICLVIAAHCGALAVTKFDFILAP